MNWTEERVALLRKLWTEDFSASRIAAELGGVSRSAVIGKIHRLGLCGRGKPVWAAKRQPKPRLPNGENRGSQRAACRTASLGNTALKIRPDMLEEAQVQPLESIVVPIARKLTIDKLTEHTCKWPIGDPGDEAFHFCGHDSLAAMPYCPYHARLAYRGHGSRSTG